MEFNVEATNADLTVVTGGASGIGRACVDAIVKAGGRAVSIDRTRRQPVPGVLDLIGDVTSPEDLQRCHREVPAEWGSVRNLVVSAAVFPEAQGVDRVSPLEARRVLEVNILGALLTIAEFMPAIRRSRGSIVVIGSLAGVLGSRLGAVYASSKAALTALVRSTAIDEGPDGVRINLVVPANVITEQRTRYVSEQTDPQAMDRYLDRMSWTGFSTSPEEIARLTMLLMCEGLPSLTGSQVHITGGVELGAVPKVTYEQWLELSTSPPRASWSIPQESRWGWLGRPT